jgi:hypothetical protein
MKLSSGLVAINGLFTTLAFAGDFCGWADWLGNGAEPNYNIDQLEVTGGCISFGGRAANYLTLVPWWHSCRCRLYRCVRSQALVTFMFLVANNTVTHG